MSHEGLVQHWTSAASPGQAPDMELPPASEQADLPRHTPGTVFSGGSRKGQRRVGGLEGKTSGRRRDLPAAPPSPTQGSLVAAWAMAASEARETRLRTFMVTSFMTGCFGGYVISDRAYELVLDGGGSSIAISLRRRDGALLILEPSQELASHLRITPSNFISRAVLRALGPC